MDTYMKLRSGDDSVVGPLIHKDHPRFYDQAVAILYTLDPEVAEGCSPTESYNALPQTDRWLLDISVIDALADIAGEVSGGRYTFDLFSDTHYGFLFATLDPA